MSKTQRGEIALFSAAILYGLFGVFSKVINFQIPIFYQSWIRNILSILILAILVLFLKKWKKVTPLDNIWIMFRGVSGFISFIAMYIAFTKLDIGTTYFLSYAATVIAGYVLGVLVFKEALTKKGIVALVLSLAGLLFVYNVTFSVQTLPFILLAIVSGIAAPGWNAFSKMISSKYSNFQLNLFDSVYAFIFPFVVSLGVHETWVPITLTPVWGYTFLFGMMFMATGFLIVYGFSKVSAQAGILILLFEIIAGIIFGYIFFHETLAIGEIIGGVCILGAIVLRSSDPESI